MSYRKSSTWTDGMRKQHWVLLDWLQVLYSLLEFLGSCNGMFCFFIKTKGRYKQYNTWINPEHMDY